MVAFGCCVVCGVVRLVFFFFFMFACCADLIGVFCVLESMIYFSRFVTGLVLSVLGGVLL